jgi:hypothetical protein
MNRKSTLAATLATSAFVFAGSANAQTTQTKDEVTSDTAAAPLTAPTHAVELTIGTGYAQAFGDVGNGQRKLTDISQGGGAVQLGVGYRILPALTLGVYGSGSTFSRADQVSGSANIYSASAGVYTDYHFLPRLSQFDPWVSLGSGWLGYWTSNDTGSAPGTAPASALGTTSTQGVEWARLQIGVDYRIAQSVAISPVVGADLSTFFTQSTPASNGSQNISSPTVNSFFFAGLQGRFDIPTQSSASQVASR